jgi:S-DNA-T family DNA segregation ATPase FtsK/SpoIIIE
MDRRFKYLEKKKLKEIDPARDKMDKIIIGIDEASVLYTKSKNNSKNKLINEARELTEELSKLSRAAGIHLILATQKVTKETIDTKVQENIGGRVCFRMNTLQGSMTVLGNKMALTLPDIKGRAIWARGNKFTQIQAPFLSEDELEEELSILKNELVSKERKFHGPMISTDVLKTNMDDEITDLEKNDSSGASRSPE